jgi:hypothetical protein
MLLISGTMQGDLRFFVHPSKRCRARKIFQIFRITRFSLLRSSMALLVVFRLEARSLFVIVCLFAPPDGRLFSASSHAELLPFDAS